MLFFLVVDPAVMGTSYPDDDRGEDLPSSSIAKLYVYIGCASCNLSALSADDTGWTLYPPGTRMRASVVPGVIGVFISGSIDPAGLNIR